MHLRKQQTLPKNKVISVEESMSCVKSGMSIAIGGLTIYENDSGFRDRGTVELVKQGKVKRIVASHVGTTPEVGKAMNEGRLEVVPTPQGTLAEMMRCTFPLTGAKECDVIITERAVFRRRADKGFVLEEVARGYSLAA